MSPKRRIMLDRVEPGGPAEDVPRLRGGTMVWDANEPPD